MLYFFRREDMFKKKKSIVSLFVVFFHIRDCYDKNYNLMKSMDKQLIFLITLINRGNLRE
jgi:hypothetical protein